MTVEFFALVLLTTPCPLNNDLTPQEVPLMDACVFLASPEKLVLVHRRWTLLRRGVLLPKQRNGIAHMPSWGLLGSLHESSYPVVHLESTKEVLRGVP